MNTTETTASNIGTIAETIAKASDRTRIYQQTSIDTYSKMAFAKFYESRTPITAAVE